MTGAAFVGRRGVGACEEAKREEGGARERAGESARGGASARARARGSVGARRLWLGLTIEEGLKVGEIG